MTESKDSGWLFEEALAKTSDPCLWDRYQAEKRQHTPTLANLRRSIIAGLCAKIDTKLFAAVPRAIKSDGGWTMLDRAALEKRIANPNERIEEIGIFATLKAPNTAEQLKDQGLAEAFQRCVLDDPEVAVLLQRNSTPNLFREGRAPGWHVSYHWSLQATAPEIARSIEPRLLILGEPDRTPTREASTLAEAVVDRIGAFRDLLVSGKIRAYGLSTRFGESFVPARQWARQNLSIDVANSDLCEEDARGNFLPTWTGIELRSAMTEIVQREEPTRKAAAPARKRRAKGQEVEGIIKKKGIDVGQVGPKAAAAEVMKYMKKPPESANEVKALEALVRRISSAVDQTF